MEVLTVEELPKEEYYMPGNALCAGCGESLAMRLALKILGWKTIVVTVPGCMSASLIMGASAVPLLVGPFASGGALLSGIETALEAQGITDVNVVAFIGDGGTADIGFQALSAMVERGHNVLYICLDNEAYMNTGGQRSGMTPLKASTTTTPGMGLLKGKLQPKKDMPLIMAEHGAPYVATASIGFPLDYMGKVKRAMKIRGPKYIQVLCPCPVGWGYHESKTVEIARLAVACRVWPLYEVEGGKFTLTYEPREPKPLREYLRAQRRFDHLTEEDMAELERLVEEKWRRLKLRSLTG
ncbi:MAG: pyruvate synthase subunit beta [Candidatus Hecatellales archaeon]|nr:MAG: pyruvate synthase subunit beta [Candidatus Hecatellales archaeon]